MYLVHNNYKPASILAVLAGCEQTVLALASHMSSQCIYLADRTPGDHPVCQ